MSSSQVYSGFKTQDFIIRLVRLHETEQRFQDTLRLRERMHAAVENWGDKPDKKPSGNVIYHLIDEFTKTPE